MEGRHPLTCSRSFVGRPSYAQGIGSGQPLDLPPHPLELGAEPLGLRNRREDSSGPLGRVVMPEPFELCGHALDVAGAL